MFEFGFKNKTEAPKVKINKNIFPIFNREKKEEEKKEDKKVQFKFTGDGEAQRFVNADPVERLGEGIKESLMAPKQADPEILVHPHREKDVLRKMIASSYENIFNIEIPEDKEYIKKEFEEARGKGGKFNRIRASFAATIRNGVGLSNEEVEERMQGYYLKKMKDLDISEELKEFISGEWKLSEVEAEETYEDEVGNVEKSVFENRIKEIEEYFEYLKEKINSSTEDSLRDLSFYKARVVKVNKGGLNEDEIQKVNAIVSEYENKINEVWKSKKQKFEYEGRLKYRIEMVQRALNGWKDEIKKIKPEEETKLKDLQFYIYNVSEPKEDGLKGEYLEKLRSEAKKAKKEITHVWQEKKHELENEKIKSDFENAIRKIRKISRSEYRSKYGSKDAGEHWLEYDLRNKIHGYLNFYFDHVVHPVDASPIPEDWNEKWNEMRSLVEKINSETQYELVIVNGETYSVQVQDQDFSHMSESYDGGFELEKEIDGEQQFSRMAGNFEGYASDNELAKDFESEKKESHTDGRYQDSFEDSKFDSNLGDEIIEERNEDEVVDSEATLSEDNIKSEESEKGESREQAKEGEESAEAEAGAGAEESHEENEEIDVEAAFKKLPDGIISVFKRYAAILIEKLGGEITDREAIENFLIFELTRKYDEKKEVMLNDFGFTEKDGKIFIEKIVDEITK